MAFATARSRRGCSSPRSPSRITSSRSCASSACGPAARRRPQRRGADSRKIGSPPDVGALGGAYRGRMKLYAILRRSGWRSGEELEQAAARSTRVGNEDMPDDVRWIRSYVLDEGGGSVGTVCIYEATSPEAIRKHASLADLPVDEIIAVADSVLVREDPQPAAA